MKDQNIIMVCQQNWDLGIGSNAKNLAKEFAKQNRVLYVNIPLDVNTLLRGYRRPEVRKKFRVVLGQLAGLAQVEPNLWVYTPDTLCLSVNWLSSKSLFSALNQFNSKLLANSIQKATRELGFDAYYLFQDGIVFHALDLPRQLRAVKFVYYLRDYMLTVPYFRRHGPWVEAQVMEQADLVASNSMYLNDYARRHNPRHSQYIGQGCVLSLYQAPEAHALPPDLAAVPHPIIGYTGSLTGLRLDIDLLVAIAQNRPDWSLVLVGPEDPDFQQSILHKLPNVHFLGRKAPEELPAYVSHFDICINPQVINEVTVGNYPLKIDEYLAMGKPVVATRTRTMELFEQHVYLADGQAQWLLRLAQALDEPDAATLTASRIAFAQSHTWAASVGLLYEALEAADY
ncbi:hypothetical protein A0257_11590 [Hymenobacter psoromatis]|nr:hypothetical protein A0257_11590 [Hymenobacter psoromatis]